MMGSLGVPVRPHVSSLKLLIEFQLNLVFGVYKLSNEFNFGSFLSDIRHIVNEITHTFSRENEFPGSVRGGEVLDHLSD
jgi:hypothetical protein